MSHRPPIGVTGRGLHDPDPVRHATSHRRRTVRGRTLAALCGAGVYDRGHLLGPFDPDHPRACPACARAFRAEARR